MRSNNENYNSNTYGDGIFEENALMPDEAFLASYEVDGQKHDVMIQWMGEGRNVNPGYYVFEGEKYTAPKPEVNLKPEDMLTMSEDELRAVFSDDEDLNPSEATRVIDFIEDFGWNERGFGQTEHAKAISRVIEKAFS